MSCTEIAASAPIQEVLWCGIELATGSFMLAAILIFILMLYGMYKLRLPFEVQVPIGLFVLFVFAGAGTFGLRLGGVDAFTTMMLIAVMVVGAIIVLAFWRLRRT